jgi:membrane protein
MSARLPISRHWWAVHLRWWWSDARLLVRRTASEYNEDHCPQLAASISYYVLFSVFPLAILAVSVAGLVLTDDSVRASVVNDLFDILPLSDDQGREDLEGAVDSIATGLSAIGLISILGLMWSASGMMGALRFALNQAWDIEYRRPFLRGKFIDLLMVMGVGILITLSVGTTVFLQVARRVSDDLSDSLGVFGAGASGGGELLVVVVPLVFSFATFLFIFRFIPDVRTKFRFVWPGALLSAVLFELVKNGFAMYLRFFGDYDAVYGSLGAVIAFLFFIYISANIVLLGAEMAAEWPRVMHGHYDDSGDATPAAGPDLTRASRARGALTKLVRQTDEMPHHIADTSGRAVREARKAEQIAQRIQSDAPVDAPPDAADAQDDQPSVSEPPPVPPSDTSGESDP